MSLATSSQDSRASITKGAQILNPSSPAVRLLVDSLKIYSPSGEESKLASFLCDRMKAAGFSRVRIDRAGNAVGEVGKGTLGVLLCGHIDTVPGKLPVSLRGGIASGRGATDAKAAICAFLTAASRFIDDPILHVTVVGATGEEGDSRGIKELLRSRRKYAFAVFGEPGGAGRVTVGYRGRVALHVSLSTEGGHAGSSWVHASAYDHAVALAKELRSLEQAKDGQADHFHSVSITPTLFEAGEYQNVVPSSARFICDVRVPLGLSCAQVQRELAGVIISFSKRVKVSVNYEFEEGTEPYEATSSSTLARAFQRGIILKARSRPVLLKKTGTGDMNTFASKRNAECVTYGPGDSSLSHTINESINVEDYLLSIEVLSEALNQLKILKPAH